MNMPGNWTRGLLSLQKQLLYCSCIIFIAIYDFQLWFFAGAPTKAQVLLLVVMWYKVALWILSTFHTSPTSRIEALTGLILIQPYLKKLVQWSCFRTATFSSQYILIYLLSARNSKNACSHLQSLVLLNNVQYTCLKGPLLYTKALLLNLTKHFNFFDTEAIPGCRLLDSFSDCISFHPCNCSSLNNCIAYLESLDYFCHKVTSSLSTLVVFTDIDAISPRNI